MNPLLWRLGVGAVMFALAMDIDIDTDAKQAVFRSKVDTVTLDVLATNGGVTIPNLRAEDFTVRDDGVQQVVTHVSGDASALALHLLLDISGSLSARDLANLQQGAAEVVRLSRSDDRLRLVTFTDVVRLHDDVDAASIGPIFQSLKPEGDTALHDALAAAFHLGDQPGPRRPVAIVFSDGADTASWLNASAIDETAKRSWTSVFAISPRAGPEQLLSDLTDVTGGELIVLSRGLAGLPDTLRGILERLRQRYLLAFTPTSSASGWHELEVRVKKPNAKVVARRGYLRR
jgi:Ca-activated chloride channel family protein